jgi:hypothetical protein
MFIFIKTSLFFLKQALLPHETPLQCFNPLTDPGLS